MKRSEVYKAAINLVSDHYNGETRIRMIEVLAEDLRVANWCERQEEKEAEQNG